MSDLVSGLVEGRYAKQILFAPIGQGGQERIRQGTALIVGLGALGTVSAGILCRAGVGRLRLVDRDFVELSNLQRQNLFDEEDADKRLPKAVAAANKLARINSEVALEPIIADVHADNVLEIIAGASVVVDGTDNLETRFLLNDACVKMGIPWVYGGALGATGSTMPILPGRTPCFRCLVDHLPPPGSVPSCDTEGVLAAVTSVVGALESAFALKILVGQAPDARLVTVDVWETDLQVVELQRRQDCPACGRGEFEFLSGARTSWTTVLCGRNAVQIVPPGEHQLDLQRLKERLASVGEATFNGFLLSFRADDYELVLFPNGRAIIKGTTDEATARILYARYVGT
ncbi:MAG: ThiF family adenylyltransferase [Chloroflexi bacterium]|nr:ThiF family adenylyltransferase [Chloroflexota bacterium]